MKQMIKKNGKWEEVKKPDKGKKVKWKNIKYTGHNLVLYSKNYIEGKNAKANSPSNLHDAEINEEFPILNSENKAIFSFGDYTWDINNSNSILTKGNPKGTVYGPVKLVTINSPWSFFSQISGEKIISFKKSNNMDGGKIIFYYNKETWEYAFSGSNEDIVIAQNGSIYKSHKDGLVPKNLVNTWDGIPGPAGSDSMDAEYVNDKPRNIIGII